MARSLSQILRMPPAEALCYIAPDEPRLEGVLYAERAPAAPSVAEAVVRWQRGQYVGGRSRIAAAHQWQLISGGALASEARTELSLDGVVYDSVRRFYEALKIPDGELRARFLAGTSRQELGVTRGHADGSFEYGGATIAVGSLEHLQLIARAVSAKVAAHEWVRKELRATGRARLVMGAGQPLGRVMPFALMVERLHLGP